MILHSVYILATVVITFAFFQPSFAADESKAPVNTELPSQFSDAGHFSSTNSLLVSPQSPSKLINHFEFYSETTSHRQKNSIVQQSRLRWLISHAHAMPETLAVYLGAGIDRELGAPEQQWIQNSWRPQIGFQWKPSPYLQTWIEYNQRHFAQKNTDEIDQQEHDPRWGLAATRAIELKNSEREFGTIENYFEAVSYFRAHREPVISGFFRPSHQFNVNTTLSASPYAELYFQRSPLPEIGLNTNQIRGGLKLQAQWSSLSATVYGYWPQEVGQTSTAANGQFVSLLVLGGYF